MRIVSAPMSGSSTSLRYGRPGSQRHLVCSFRVSAAVYSAPDHVTVRGESWMSWLRSGSRRSRGVALRRGASARQDLAASSRPTTSSTRARRETDQTAAQAHQRRSAAADQVCSGPRAEGRPDPRDQRHRDHGCVRAPGGGVVDPRRVRHLVGRDFGSVEAWRSDLKATRWPARWAWTASDWDEGDFDYIGDARTRSPSTRHRSCARRLSSPRTSSTPDRPRRVRQHVLDDLIGMS